MKTININRNDLIAIKREAKKNSANVYQFYKLRDIMYNKHLQKVTKNGNLFFATNGEDVAELETVKTKEKIFSKEGFTADEYTKLTGETLPNQSGAGQIKEYNGKIYFFPEAGNFSPETFSKKGELITEVETITNIKVNIVKQTILNRRIDLNSHEILGIETFLYNLFDIQETIYADRCLHIEQDERSYAVYKISHGEDLYFTQIVDEGENLTYRLNNINDTFYQMDDEFNVIAEVETIFN